MRRSPVVSPAPIDLAKLQQEWDEAVRSLLADSSARMMNLIDGYDAEMLTTCEHLKDRKVEGKTAIYAAVRAGDRECGSCL